MPSRRRLRLLRCTSLPRQERANRSTYAMFAVWGNILLAEVPTGALAHTQAELREQKGKEVAEESGEGDDRQGLRCLQENEEKRRVQIAFVRPLWNGAVLLARVPEEGLARAPAGVRAPTTVLSETI